MADSDRPGRKTFDVQNPGPREYIIVLAVVGGAAYLYFRHQQKTAAAAQTQAAAPAGGAPMAGAGGGGLPWGALFAWMQNHQSSPAPADSDTTGSSGGGKQSATVRVPNVVGQPYATGQANLAKVNLYSYPHNTPSGKGKVYISGQNPGAGRVVKRDSGVDLVLVRR